MNQPTDEDFKAHSLTMCHKHGMAGAVAFGAACIELGYKMALRHSADEVSKATKELAKFRESNNAPR